MPSYRRYTFLPPCHIDKEVLIRLEEYIFKQADPQGPSQISDYYKGKHEYRVVLTDRSSGVTGVEELKSVNEYSSDYFPNTITKASLKYKEYHDRALEINLTFSSVRTETVMDVGMQGESRREFMNAVEANVISLLEGCKRRGLLALLVSRPALSTIIISFAFWISLFTAASLLDIAVFSGVIYSLFCGLMLSTVVITFITSVRYTTFKTIKHEESEDRNKWLVRSIVGIVLAGIFGPVITLIVKKCFPGQVP